MPEESADIIRRIKSCSKSISRLIPYFFMLPVGVWSAIICSHFSNEFPLTPFIGFIVGAVIGGYIGGGVASFVCVWFDWGARVLSLLESPPQKAVSPQVSE